MSKPPTSTELVFGGIILGLTIGAILVVEIKLWIDLGWEIGLISVFGLAGLVVGIVAAVDNA